MASMTAPDSPDRKEYHGNCHCGAFRFTIKIPPLKLVRSCNCSLCFRNGYMWIFPVPDDDFSIEKGEGTLKEYEFGKKRITHMFCPICGTSVMGRYKPSPEGKGTGINVGGALSTHLKSEVTKEPSDIVQARAIKDIDLDALEVEEFKGADLDPPYEPPVSSSQPRDAEDGLKIYNGNCHCGAVIYTVKSKPLEEVEVMSCNCSLCSRNGDLWIYPKKEAVDLQGQESLTNYAFLHEDSLHSLCSTCGVSMVVRVLGDGADDNICPVNVRTINGIQLDLLKFKKYDGKKNDPQYVLRN